MTEKPPLEDLQKLPGFKANNPQYFDDPAIDQLMDIVLKLGAELWTLRDRQAMLEEMLAEHGEINLEQLDKGRPSEPLAARLKDEREEFTRRLYGKLFAAYGGDKIEPKSVIM